MIKASVILTSYNRPYYLMQSISSVLNQSTRDFELIICDDNSPDPLVREILDTFEEHDSHVRVYHSEVKEEDRYKTARYATMINHAVRKMAKGEYITYLTDDDIFYPDRLERGIEMLDANPDYQVIYFNQNVLSIDLAIEGVRHFNDEPMNPAYNKIDHNSVMHRNKLFFQVGGWPDSPGIWGGADAHFFKRINDRGILFMPVGGHPGDGHRYHTESVQWKLANDIFFP